MMINLVLSKKRDKSQKSAKENITSFEVKLRNMYPKIQIKVRKKLKDICGKAWEY